jgi:hypothetical protein
LTPAISRDESTLSRWPLETTQILTRFDASSTSSSAPGIVFICPGREFLNHRYVTLDDIGGKNMAGFFGYAI